MNFGLVDYGSSSPSSSETEEEPEPSEKPEDEVKPSVAKLPKPSLDAPALQTSVFSNPFVEAELAKAAILEKHVKMVPGKEETQMINGKKICWSHRKGRCRFGHRCKFAHDTDIQKSPEELEAEKQRILSRSFCEGADTVTSTQPQHVPVEEVNPTDDAVWEGGSDRKKLKRPGLSQGLIPGQKVLKMYKQQKLKEKKN
ncbi:unnamed protein product [Plutella xylostella]|uniref:(diamondback moth) hypothetical protein n=1 Tax=Plutella xylostella TaxID=51655 RepID=A0A8S4DA59_PLUXY|nr:unnamed protein product [Plutella xylostella]